MPEVAAIDVYVDGARVVSNLALGEASPHLQTPSRAATVSIRPAGAAFTTAPIASRELNLVTTSGGFGHVSVVFQLDGFAQPTISTVEDLLAPTRTDGARLHVIHAVPDGPAIGIQTDQGAGFLSGAMFNTQVPTVDPPTGAYNLQVRNSDTDELLNIVRGVNMSHGFLYTVLVYPGENGLVAANVFAAPVMPDPAIATNQVQWVHASADGGALDVYLDGMLVAPNMQAGNVRVHSPYAIGSYVLSVRNAGLPPTSTPAYESSITLSGETVTLVMRGSLAEGTFGVVPLEDFEFSLTSTEARLRVMNATTNGPLTLDLDGITQYANVLPVGENSPQTQVEPGVYTVNGIVDDAEIGGPLFIEEPNIVLAGGTIVTFVVTTDADGEPLLNVTTSYLQSHLDSLPGAADAPPPTPTATATFTTTPTPLPPTATATPIVGTPPPADNQPLMIADVNINSGVNLQCREYPSSVSRSINLIPANVRLVILGYAAPLDPNLELNVPVDPANFNGVEFATDWEQVWVQSHFFADDGTLSRCWVRSDFLLMYYYDGAMLNFIGEPSGFFGFAALDPPIIAPIPANTSGDVLGAGVGNRPFVLLPTPTATFTPTATATVTASPTATATPDTSVRASVLITVGLLERGDFNATVLREIPSGAMIELLGRNLDGSLLNVRYEVLGEGIFEGWVRSGDVQILTAGASIADLPVTQ